MIEATNVDVVARDFTKAGVFVQLNVGRLVADTAARVAATQRTLIPVATGKTKSQIKVRLAPDQLSATVGVSGNRRYIAWFLEYGTVKMGPRPFVGPSASKHLPGFERALAELAVDV